MPRTKEAFEAMRETTKGKIEAAALSLFARKGLSVTIDEIAKTAGVSTGLLYSHYPSKEALIKELFRQAALNASTIVKEITDGKKSAVEKVKEITALMCEMLSTDHIGIDYLIFTIQVGMNGFPVSETELYTADNPHPVESLARVIAECQAEGSAVKGEPVHLALIFWAAVEGLCCFAISGILLPPVYETLSRIILKEE